MSQFFQQLLNGLSLGSIYAVLSLGLAMIYGTLGILNFAYGELITITGYTMYFATQAGLSFAAAAALGAIAAAVASVLMQQLVFRPLQRAGFVTLLFASFALSEVLQGVFRQAVSPRAKGIPLPDALSNTIVLGTLRISMLTIITFVVAIVALPEQDGLRLTTNIVGCPPSDVQIGMAVRVVFEHRDPVWFPLFERDEP